MNLYCVVEGKTEKKVYPSWLNHLAPRISQVDDPTEVKHDDFFLIGGGGFPYIYKLIEGAEEDIHNNPAFDILLVGLDTDSLSAEEKSNEILEFCECNIDLKGKGLKVVPQAVCIESWFLANERVISSSPTDPELISLVNHYDVSKLDPESMDVIDGWAGSKAMFHFHYLKKALATKHVRYSKKNPGHVLEEPYLERVVERVNRDSGECETLRGFIEFAQAL